MLTSEGGVINAINKLNALRKLQTKLSIQVIIIRLPEHLSVTLLLDVFFPKEMLFTKERSSLIDFLFFFKCLNKLNKQTLCLHE